VPPEHHTDDRAAETCMSFDTERPFVLTATCASRMGTTARVTTFLASRRFYIVEMQQFDDTISQRFFVRITFCAVQGDKVDIAALRKEFQEVADVEQMEWKIHDSRERSRVLIMVSNYDHCLEDLLYRHRIGELQADITAIVSNHVTLQPIAAQNRIPFFHLPVTPQTKPQQEQKLLELVDSTRTDLVVLARYMQILSDDLCGKLRGRAINIHHSFLPGFKGAKPYHQAYDRGVKVIGATAHFVTADLDEGPIIEQIVEHVDHAYTPDMLVAAGRDSERRALSRAVRLATEQRVFLNGNRTVIFR
jgi:formyltetrahydrofolate deformylase